MTIKKQTVEVAIAVLVFADELLLARRHSHQHQGGKLEFVGGKIDRGETPRAALVREVNEEIGLDITNNVSSKLGRIYHDYADKSVCLHVYQVSLSDQQYQAYQDKTVGLDGQAIGFYKKSWVLTQTDDFPQANQSIFTWLKLPPVLAISHALSAFQDVEKWAAYYAQRLPCNAVLSIRLQTDQSTAWQAILTLSLLRDDLVFILPWHMHQDTPKDFGAKVLALHLTHQALLALDLSIADLPTLPLIASCHDVESIKKANLCAKSLPMLGIFLSPVLPTQSHPQAPVLGWDKFAQLAKLSDVPVVALGGLSVQALPQALAHGAVAVSGIRQFC